MSKVDKVHKLVEKGKEDALLKMLTDRDPAVALAAIEGLGKVGAEAAVTQLITMLHDASPAIRAACAAALGQLHDPRAQSHLSHAMEIEQDSQTKQAMIDALSKLSSSN